MKTTIGFPVFFFAVRVHYSVPRPPTAFEYILLKLCDRFSAESVYATIELAQLFSDMLGLTDPGAMLRETVQELVAMEVLRRRDAVSNDSPLTLSTIEVTERGRQILQDGMLPARPQFREQRFSYDPVRASLSDRAAAKALTLDAPLASIDASVYENIFPEHLMRDHLLRGDCDWLPETGRIEKIESLAREVRWANVPATIQIAEGTLHIATNDAEQTNYLGMMPGSVLYERIVQPLLMGTQELAAGLSELSPCDLTKAGDGKDHWQSCTGAAHTLFDEASVCLVNASVPYLPIPDSAKSGQVLLCHNSAHAEDTVAVAWNSTDDGCIVHLTDGFALANAIAATPTSPLQLYRARVKIGKDYYEVPLATRTDAAAQNEAITKHLAKAAEALLSCSDARNAIIPLLWTPAPVFWQQYATAVSAQSVSLRSKLELFVNVHGQLQSYARTSDTQPWAEALIAVITKHVRQENFVSLDDLDATINALLRHGVLNHEDASRLITKLLAAVPLPRTLDEFARISKIVNQEGVAHSIPYPSPLYTQAVLAGVAQNFGETILDCFRNKNDFDQTLTRARTAFTAIVRGLNVKNMAALTDQEAIAKAMNTLTPAKLDDVAQHALV